MTAWLHRRWPWLFRTHDYQRVELLDLLQDWYAVDRCRWCGHIDEARAEYLRPLTR